MEYSRRQVIKYLSLLPFMRAIEVQSKPLVVTRLNDDYVIVNGWILKKSDLVEEFE